MFVIKKNQVIITALVVMIGVAGYLNYIDNSTEPTEVLLNDEEDISALIPDSDFYGEAVHTNSLASNE